MVTLWQSRQWDTVPIQLSSNGDFPLRMFEHRGTFTYRLRHKVAPSLLLVRCQMDALVGGIAMAFFRKNNI